MIEAQGLFAAIGQMPENTVFENLVELDAGGYIAAGEDCLTRTNGIYTASDCRTKTVSQLTTAAADGAVVSWRQQRESNNGYLDNRLRGAYNTKRHGELAVQAG